MNVVDPALPLLASGVTVDLDNCAQEPIHVPGSIQPRGALLAVDEESLVVFQVSANLLDVIGVEVADAVGHELVQVLGSYVTSTIM